MSMMPKDTGSSIPDSSQTGLVGEPGVSLSLPVQEGCEERSNTQPSQKQLESTNTNTSSVHLESSLLALTHLLDIGIDNDNEVGVGLVGKRLILQQEDEERARRNGSVATTNSQATRRHNSDTGILGMVGKLLVLEQEEAQEAEAGSPYSERNPVPREPGVGETPTAPAHLRRNRKVRTGSTLPGAVSVQGIQWQQQQQRQVPSQAVAYSSESELDISIHDNHAEELAEAEAVDDVEQPQTVAHPSIDGTHRRETITQKYQVRFAGFLLLLLLGCGIIIGSICGAGLCGSSNDSVEPSKTSRDILQAPKMGSVITGILGQDYFDGIEEFGESNDHDGSQFLQETRQKALDWMVNQDPRQLEYDAPNLVQRFLLVLLYYQTTRHKPWKDCNPPSTSQASASVRFCYEPDRITGETTSNIWGDQWLSASHECQWAGVTCEMGQSKESEVVELVPWWNQLNGPLPWEITRLPQLKQLVLGGNLLTGLLPPVLLSKESSPLLKALQLDNNQLSGTIPARWFEGTETLTKLDISANRLTGRIPSEVGLFPLTYLYLDHNSMTGSLPLELFYQGSIEWLLLGNNDLTGILPSEVGLLTNLNYLFLSGTSLSGSLPSEIGLASQMQELGVSYTNMQGTLPEELYGLTGLYAFTGSGCNFSGTISSSLGLLTNLYVLELANNNFHGTLPNEIQALTTLRRLLVNGNQFTSTVPVAVCQNLYAEGIQSKVVADCLPDSETGVPAIQCSCCTSCCDNTGYCLAH
ncbi:leucine Rich Repeat [Seminavis robusta]|uniref:Leucine Rich Repeat n=1 Tax=Seminavis robusta TaxID=568900 RepID=A0A9N8HPJ3_9STRA|nr:leucine Rich Repeat [Seminavis robusta]|eukprot:Sro1185_g250200.1 leucine Rich Repeat (754) ;mRNA; r:15179-17592